MFFFQKTIWRLLLRVSLKKGWTGTRIAKEFPNKKWNYRSINRVLAKHRHTGTTIEVIKKRHSDRKKGSGRPVTAMTDENLAEVEQLCQSLTRR